MTPFLSNRVYIFLFSLLAFVYFTGLFVPLMDNDSAHHANIALHMYLHRDYADLVDAGKDYLDKPHLLFWLCALSYNLFGVTTFTYKFPSFLFTILAVYSTYRLGKALYNDETGKLSALLIASAFAFILANNDVRMDAILTACVALATWQGVEFIQRKRILNAAGLALGLALGFNTKGHIAVFTPAVGLLFYILYRKDWRTLWNWKWIIVLIGFAAFIAPVVYCFYLQYNLHPERVVRGRDHINGIKFILLGQSIERFQGEAFGGGPKNDYLFFFHSFLWAFAPWSILAYAAIINRFRSFLKRKDEWLSTATIVAIAAILTFSGFKLPHYLNIIFPAASVMTASWMISNRNKSRLIFCIQVSVCSLILILMAMVNAWAFPVNGVFIFIGLIFLLAVVFYFLKSQQYALFDKSVYVSVACISFSFFLLNSNFYPQLLTYQGGNQLAKMAKGNLDPADVYFWKDNYSSSFNFYTATERKEFNDSLWAKGKAPLWLLFDIRDTSKIRQDGYRINIYYSSRDYEITKLDFKFINPATRDRTLTRSTLGEITGRQ
ncbi:MAG TPA: glycosyltransferase family 39 protein [Chitinophagaceae bacterium]|nr:glycosyltransferase family 39 protein [Chitinophagaceae bacterium]